MAIPRAIALPSFGPKGICASLNKWTSAAPISGLAGHDLAHDWNDREETHPGKQLDIPQMLDEILIDRLAGL
jgi:hypothetical protein